MPESDLAVWRLARRRLFLPVTVLFAVVSLVCLAGVSIPEPVQYVPFAVGLVALGLPHGALDHLVPARLASRPATLRRIAPVLALYGVLATGVLALWWAAPPLAFVFFIGLTWFHWGQGDLFALHQRSGYPGAAGRTAASAATLVLRGALPMLVPLIAFPQVYLAVAASATGVFAPGRGGAGTEGGSSGASWVTDAAATLTSTGGRIGLALGIGALVLVTIILNRSLLRGSDRARRAWAGETAETLVLVLFFWAVPPVLAVGLYFCLWHSLRHVVRLCLLDPHLKRPLQEGRFGVAFLRFTRQAAPVTLIALVILVALFFAVPHAGTDLPSLLGLYLVLISALTAPHVVIVAVMDRVQARQDSQRREALRTVTGPAPAPAAGTVAGAGRRSPDDGL